MTTKSDTHQRLRLNGLSDIRRFFYANETPIYFIGDTNFNLLGADVWIKGFKFITYYDCFDGLHPNVFVPQKHTRDAAEMSLPQLNNYLLTHPEVVDYIHRRGPGGKALFLMFDEQTEALARDLGLEVCFPASKLRTRLDSKLVTTRIADRAGVKSVPNVLARVDSFATLQRVSRELGPQLVIQTPYGDSGHTTYFISNEADWNQHAASIAQESEVKVMKRIRCRETAMEACITHHGTLVAPMLTELIGFPELTPYGGGWCGNEVLPAPFTPKIRRAAREAAESMGAELQKEGYKGYFELDMLVDEDSGALYLGELNPRITGASSITNHALFGLADAPLVLFHILEWFDVDYRINPKYLNRRWAHPDNIDTWGQLIFMLTEKAEGKLKTTPETGIWKMGASGKISFDRYETMRRAVEDENEAFFMHILGAGDTLYDGAELGFFVTRGRLMTEDFELSEHAKRWIAGIRAHYAFGK